MYMCEFAVCVHVCACTRTSLCVHETCIQKFVCASVCSMCIYVHIHGIGCVNDPSMMCVCEYYMHACVLSYVYVGYYCTAICIGFIHPPLYVHIFQCILLQCRAITYTNGIQQSCYTFNHRILYASIACPYYTHAYISFAQFLNHPFYFIYACPRAAVGPKPLTEDICGKRSELAQCHRKKLPRS